MINNLSVPSTLLFGVLTVVSILILLFSTSWIIIWTCLELNTVSFLPIIITNNSIRQSEGAFSYYVVQGCGSSIYIISILHSSNNPGLIHATLIYFSLSLKLGIAPTHSWIVSLISSMDWPPILILSTWQNVGGLSLLLPSACLISSHLVLPVALLNTAWGSLGALKQTNMRGLIAYSSISHLGWILSTLIISTSYFIIYLIIYSIIIVGVTHHIYHQSLNNTYSPNTDISCIEPRNALLYVNILSLGGIPPLIGFYPNAIIVASLIHIYTTFTAIMTIITSLSLYFYFIIIIGSVLYPLNFNKGGNWGGSGAWITSLSILSIATL